jgi:tetratricopeptide (TPR) repeat protein
MLEKIYSNMAACHIKNGNWKRALETADKVSVNPGDCLGWFTKVNST